MVSRPRLQDALRESDIHPRLAAGGVQTVFNLFDRSLAGHPRVSSLPRLLTPEMAGMPSAATFLSSGIWLPHFRTPRVVGVVIAAASFLEPWTDPILQADHPVRFAFLVLAQQGLITEYLTVVGELAHAFDQPGTAERLAESADRALWKRILIGQK